MKTLLKIAAVSLLFVTTGASAQDVDLDALRARAEGLSQEIGLMEDENAVENLQRAYGFFVDKGMWREVADLFAEDGTLEIGGRGVFIGPDRVYEYMNFLSSGAKRGLLMNHMSLQPVIHVADDGMSAKGRWHFIAEGGEDNAAAGGAGLPGMEGSDPVGYLGVGAYENEYVKVDGVWKISKLLSYFRMYTFDVDGWAKTALPLTTVEADLPPDLPPTVSYEMYPGTYQAPFHYNNPVTGKAVDPNAKSD